MTVLMQTVDSVAQPNLPQVKPRDSGAQYPAAARVAQACLADLVLDTTGDVRYHSKERLREMTAGRAQLLGTLGKEKTLSVDAPCDRYQTARFGA